MTTDINQQETSNTHQASQESTSAGQQQSGTVDLVAVAEQEYISNGKLSDETYKAIEQKHGLSKDKVDLIVDSRKAKVELEAQQTKQDLLSVIGGSEQKYQEMTAWAQKNYTSEEVELFDKTLASGNTTAIKQQLKVLQALYNSANQKQQGNSPLSYGAKQLSIGSGTGTAGSSGSIGDRYRNMEDMRTAMKDPRYLKDVNYTRDLQAKTARGFIER